MEQRTFLSNSDRRKIINSISGRNAKIVYQTANGVETILGKGEKLPSNATKAAWDFGGKKSFVDVSIDEPAEDGGQNNGQNSITPVTNLNGDTTKDSLIKDIFMKQRRKRGIEANYFANNVNTILGSAATQRDTLG